MPHRGHPGAGLCEADGTNPVQLTDTETYSGNPSWSRDGQWIRFHSDRGGSMQIWKISPDAGKAMQVTQSGAAQVSVEPWDGEFLYFAQGPSDNPPWRIMRIPTSGEEETEVVPAPVYGGFDVSPADGLYYATTPSGERSHGRSIVRLDLVTGETEELFRTEARASHVTVSPAEDWVAWTEYPERSSELVLVENFR